MYILRKFSVKPKISNEHYNLSVIYPVIYVVKGELYNYFGIRDDHGNIYEIQDNNVTIENIES